MACEHPRISPPRRKGGAPASFKIFAALGLCLVTSAATLGGDWPGFLGKHRDGVAQDEKPITPWKAELETLWKIPLGAGYAGAVVAEGKVFVAHRQGASDFLDCYPVRGGDRVWRATFPATYSGGYDQDKGPRAAPIFSNGQVFYYTATADLHCVDAKKGEIVWSRALGKDHKPKESYFGVGASPLVLEKLVIVPLGGKNGAGLVAVDKATGKTSWKAVEDDVSYSSPIFANFGGKPAIIAAMREKCVGIVPDNGKVLFDVPFGDRGLSVTAATPLVQGNQLFLTAEYGIGAAMLDLSKSGAPAIWENDESLSCHYNTPIFHQGFLYGTRGREDFRQGDLRCVDAADGKVKWEENGMGVAHAIRIGEQILLVGVDGKVRLINANSMKYDELARGSLGDGRMRAAPAYSDGLLFVRASLSPTKSELRCFQLGDEK